jgi:hypothetical protein
VTSSIGGWNKGRIPLRVVTARKRFNSSIVLNS